MEEEEGRGLEVAVDQQLGVGDGATRVELELHGWLLYGQMVGQQQECQVEEGMNA